MEFNHKTVLLSETLEYLSINPNGVYVDGTAGGGGLSAEIAKRLSPKGKLVCIDRDPDAISVCRERLKHFNNVEF
ncbi:MAG: 16S rRNA (cytosine(1402)-N(4))-methyltransferase, partial [Clostridia bacterium]|nr:16S rRNA (cytosine(1402)-N(4))-methyltransferase [Clostridia bacterium]